MSVLKQGVSRPPLKPAAITVVLALALRFKGHRALGDGTQPGDVDYTVSTTRFTTHGYRDHSSAQKKNLANAKLGVRIDDASKLTLIFNSVDIKADDPGGLTKSEWNANPQQSPRAEQFNTRKPSSRPVRDCAMNASLARRMISVS